MLKNKFFIAGLILFLIFSYVFTISIIVRKRVNELEKEIIKMEQGIDRLEQSIIENEKSTKELLEIIQKK